MCGLAGYHVNEQPNEIAAWLDTALELQHHRGPDGRGTYYTSNKQLGLAHNRLSIIDLSDKGSQPMRVGDWVMVFNGEIYNYRNLSSYLNAYDDLGDAQIRNDAYTFLAYINKYGIQKALDDASGMFAFAVYNQQTGIIYMGVDPFGQKPLYISPLPSGICFASTMAAIMATRSTWSIDKDALETYWMLGATMGRDQILSGIIKLNGGELLTYNTQSQQYQITNWYNPQPYIGKVPIEHLIYSAIDETKVSDVPVSIFLSGGIDSSIVASRFQAGTAVHLASPEQDYAEMTANRFKINLKVCHPEAHSAEEILTDYVTKSGQPTTAGMIPWITAKECRKHSKVAIIANGADELFFGYDRLKDDNAKTSVNQNSHTFRGSCFKAEKLNAYRRAFGSKPSSRLTDLLTFVQYDLNVTLDIASMCHGLEVRSPFLNRTLVEAALTIPESIHRAKGNKTILKNILRNLGFSQAILDRPKQGFSLFSQPSGLDDLKHKALQFVQDAGYLSIPTNASGRDRQYLTMSAVGFYIWHNVYHSKISN